LKLSDSERFARKFLEKMFGVSLRKRKLVVGYDSKNKPQIHEFDIVSEDMNIVGEIKSGRKNRDNYIRALADCMFLSRVKAKKKMLVLTDKDFYGYFKTNSEGIIAKDIDLIFVCLEDLFPKL
jgi:hypothetical protein